MNSSVIRIKIDNRAIEISLALRESGTELIFFIHGLGCVKESFIDAWKQPRLSNYSLAAIDLPGFGDSPALQDFSYTLDNYAGICREILNLFPHDIIHIVGHSMGGSIAVLLAEQIPGRVISLINIEGNLTGPDCTTSRRTASVTYEEFRTRLRRELILAAYSSDEKGMHLWAEWSARSNPLAFTGSARSLVEWSDSGELLNRFLALHCRKAYFYGERNKSIPTLSRIEGIPAIMVNRSGHFLMNDNPEEFYEKLAAMLADITS